MKKNVLFLCVANSARSQMAEGLAKVLLADVATVQSAGSEPSYVHPDAIAALNELNIDIQDQYSKSIDTINLNEVDYIITLCAEEYCPHVNAKITRLHWPIKDPAHPENDSLIGFRKARDEIKAKILEFKSKLLNP
ncbi:arsenate reductase ArsC [Francisellaceae bacterium]|nr:arsenate reductase ArsC [Francisellaceae bacterium]